MNKAVDALYEEMASRCRVRAPCLQIIKIAKVADEDVSATTPSSSWAGRSLSPSPWWPGAPPGRQVAEDHAQAQPPHPPRSESRETRRLRGRRRGGEKTRCRRRRSAVVGGGKRPPDCRIGLSPRLPAVTGLLNTGGAFL